MRPFPFADPRRRKKEANELLKPIRRRSIRQLCRGTLCCYRKKPLSAGHQVLITDSGLLKGPH